ncbi:p60 katanin-like 2 [Haematococcus lacustris]|uniref:p60 katanin-like 2 n=1 Tax=Haematococcus lacustris TaxID=44745 RepID=A0A699YPP5_HAELA|nr:p60 katanin-like 2 [Haematococcus lacustris]
MTELQQVKAISKARDLDEKRHLERRRDTLVLILRHLVDNGYTASYERLSTECNLSLGKVGHSYSSIVDVADNVDLLRVVQEFEEGYEAKYGRRPKITRRLVASVDPEEGAMRPLRRLMAKLEAAPSTASNGQQGLRSAAANGATDAPPLIQLEPITAEDMAAALSVTKPSARLQEDKYRAFSEEYGQSGT